jgi:hypothetical protein
MAMYWILACSTRGEEECIWDFIEKARRKEANRRHRRRWEDYIKIELREVGCGGIDWIDLAQDRDQWYALVNKIMNLRVP